MSSETKNLSPHRPVVAQLSIQPNIPHHMPLKATNSSPPGLGVRINDPKKVLHQNNKSFAVKKFRMRSLLWMKPAGVAETSTSSTLAQLIPTLVFNVASVSFGLSLGFSSILLPQLSGLNYNTSNINPKQLFIVSEEAGSWIASVYGLGAAVGGLLFTYLSSNHGQRKTILCLAVPDLFGWITIGLSSNVAMLCTGRFLTGIAAAGYVPAIQGYVSELAQPQHRSWLQGLTMPFISFGILLSYSIGSALSWHYVAILGSFLPLILIPSLSSASDSPYWFMMQGDEKKAVQVMERFRSKEANSLSELLAISDSIRPTTGEITFQEALQELHQRQYWKPLFVVNFLLFVAISSGSAVIIFYAVDILRMASTNYNPFESAIILAVLRLFGSLLFIPAIKYCQKKTLLMVASVVMGLSLTAFGIFLHTADSSSSRFSWLPLLALSIFVVAEAAGFGPVPPKLVDELFAPELRTTVVGLTSTIASFKFFVCVKSFKNLRDHFGGPVTFWIYASVGFLGALFALFNLKEKKGKSLHDIEKYHSLEENANGESGATTVKNPAPLISMSPSTSLQKLNVQFAS